MYKSSRIYTAMDITSETTVQAMGKSWDGKREVVGQDSVAFPTSCHISNDTSVCEVLWQATATLTS